MCILRDRTCVPTVVALLLMLAGCAANPQVDPASVDCGISRTFFVVNYGWHTGLVIEREDIAELVEPLAADFETGGYLEIGWGDQLFYESSDPGFGVMLRAALWPTATVMHVVSIPKAPQDYFLAGDLYAIAVPDAGYQNLLTFVAARFSRAEDGGLFRLGPALYGAGWFYRAEGKFHVGNTCNTWVAEALAAAGYPFADTGVVSAGGVVSQLSRGSEGRGCYDVHSVPD